MPKKFDLKSLSDKELKDLFLKVVKENDNRNLLHTYINRPTYKVEMTIDVDSDLRTIDDVEMEILHAFDGDIHVQSVRANRIKEK